MQLQGGVSQNVYQNWDKNGNIYYTDENGNRIDDRVNFIQRLTNNIKAGVTNLDSWLNKSDYNPDVQKEKRTLTLGALTAPLGIGSTATKAISTKIAPFVGSKIAQATAEGIGSGALGGGVYGFGESLIENKNPLIGGLSGAALGGLGGGLTGYGLGQVGKRLAQNRLLNEPDSFANQYFNDYIADLADKSRDMAKYRGLRQGITKDAGGEIAFDLANPRHVQQAELINKTNPAPDTYHTWIRTADDIHDYEDTLKAPLFDEDFIGNDFDDSYTWDMAQDAIKNGEIDVYSSYPIKEGVFVTPSSMEAQSYAGNNKIYMQRVPLKDVAWIDERQGQYAPIRY